MHAASSGNLSKTAASCLPPTQRCATHAWPQAGRQAECVHGQVHMRPGAYADITTCSSSELHSFAVQLKARAARAAGLRVELTDSQVDGGHHATRACSRGLNIIHHSRDSSAWLLQAGQRDNCSEVGNGCWGASATCWCRAHATHSGLGNVRGSPSKSKLGGLNSPHLQHRRRRARRPRRRRSAGPRGCRGARGAPAARHRQSAPRPRPARRSITGHSSCHSIGLENGDASMEAACSAMEHRLHG